MTLRDALTSTSDAGSLSSRLRRRRFRALWQAFPDLSEMSVVDLGGRPSTWQQLPVRPRRVVCVNFERHPGDVGITCVEGDVCDTGSIRGLGSFDLAFSNSTIEHVGGHARRCQFAETVRSAAPNYWVQTPSRYCPVEPHAVFPAYQFLPVRLRRAVGRGWPLSRLGTDGDLLEEILNIELLSVIELRYYFPDARLWKERLAGVTKSLVAYRSPATVGPAERPADRSPTGAPPQPSRIDDSSGGAMLRPVTNTAVGLPSGWNRPE